VEITGDAEPLCDECKAKQPKVDSPAAEAEEGGAGAKAEPEAAAAATSAASARAEPKAKSPGASPKPAAGKAAFWVSDESVDDPSPFKKRYAAAKAAAARPIPDRGRVLARPAPVAKGAVKTMTKPAVMPPAEEPIEPEPNSTLTDLRTILGEAVPHEAPAASVPTRRVDEDLMRLQAVVFQPGHTSDPPPPPPPATGEAGGGTDASHETANALDRCPHCGVSLVGAKRAPSLADAEPAPQPAEAVPSSAPSPAAIPLPLLEAIPPNVIAQAKTYGPWAIAGISLLIAIISLASSSDELPRAALSEAAALAASQLSTQESSAVTAAAPATPTDPGEATSTPGSDAPPPANAPRGPAGTRAASAVANAATPATAAPTAAPDPPAPAGAKGSFDRSAAMSALSSAASKAAGCHRGNDPKGSAKVSVTFAPNGRASQVQVAAPFGSTKTGGCISAAFRTATVPPFDGPAVAASKSVSIH
jgi:hypothetical protein